MAQIKALHPRPDGRVRVAQIRTADTTFTRSLVKLVRLPVEDKNQRKVIIIFRRKRRRRAKCLESVKI